jgi:hypothetical protein
MGVCLVSYAVSDANIEAVLADPPLIWRIVEFEDDTAYLRELEKSAKVSTLARLFGRSKARPEVRHLSFGEHELKMVDLDKSWDGLNACLKWCTPAVPNFFEGSGSVGKIEVGYSPAQYLRSETMSTIAAAYADITEEQVLTAFRSIKLADVYPKGLWKHGDSEVESYLTENFLALQSFVMHARQHSLGAIIQFT